MSDNFNNNEDFNQTEEQPWERKFGEDENLKNRQFSRSARNSGGKAVAPLSNVLLFVFLIVIVAPVCGSQLAIIVIKLNLEQLMM